MLTAGSANEGWRHLVVFLSMARRSGFEFPSENRSVSCRIGSEVNLRELGDECIAIANLGGLLKCWPGQHPVVQFFDRDCRLRAISGADRIERIEKAICICRFVRDVDVGILVDEKLIYRS